jgi:hypothetical protein
MKDTEVKLDEEGFEEISSEKSSQDQNQGTGGSGSPGGQGNRPDLRVVQADRDKEGNVVYTNVGGMWKNVSKNGNTFYTLRIGQLKLLVFPNDRK